MSMYEEIAEVVDSALHSERARRVQRDADRVNELALSDFRGPEYEVFRNELCRDSMPILRGMLRNGNLIRLAQQRFENKGIRFWVHPDDVALLHRSPEDRDEIIVDALLGALKTFRRKALVAGGWNPNHRGSRGVCCLTTFFIGQCIWEFRRAYVKWAKQRMKITRQEAAQRDPSALFGLFQTSGYLPGPEADTFGSAFEDILAEQPLATQAVVRLTVEGYGATEIADKLKTTRGAVSMRLTRFRSALYQAARDRRIWIPEQLHMIARHQQGQRGVA
ncbi:hypothetical protein [Streptomyces sp. KL2]|uniref:hypothetical protein n=1 Tax=Streptomyces sp. KL2 TaxID=3050126 RepID=UPI00397D938C